VLEDAAPSTFVLIPGAGGMADYFSELVPELEARGHVAIAVDIPQDNPSLGLPEFAALVDDAVGEHTDVVLVAQSMGGFTAPMIAKRAAVSRIVLLNAMIPLPGEQLGGWSDRTGADQARKDAEAAAGRSGEFDLMETFLHDVPQDVVDRLMSGDDREPSATPFGQSCDFETWPDVPIHVLVGADDRMFPVEFQCRLAEERLGVTADVMPGGHLVALSRPVDVAERLVGYLC
jgi:pimeloyl-ACP methyl ester carboxylesterase